MKIHVIFFLIIFLSSCTTNTQKESIQKSETVLAETITLIFAGDIMHHMPQMNAAYVPETNSLDYTPCFQFVKPAIEKADLAFCNLETSLGGKPYAGYPRFSSPDELLFALKDIGFDVIQMANNHVIDQGSRGLERTIQLIQNEGLHPIGAYIDKDQRDTQYPLIFKVKGVKIAVLNCTYGTNGLIIKKPTIVNLMDSVLILQDIQRAKELSADIIILLPHWGYEYHLKSSDIQHNYADFFIENGVDLIVGTHPHVVQDVAFKASKKKDKIVPVFYSLGNFISNQQQKYKNGGILARILIDTEKKHISSVSYIPTYVYKGYLNKKRQYYLIPTNDFINTPSKYPIPKPDSLSIIDFHNDLSVRLKNVMVEN